MEFSFGLKKHITTETTVALTPLGKAYAEKAEGASKVAEIVSALEAGPSTISEVANETHMATSVVMANVKQMIKSGKIRTVSGDM